MSLNRNSLSTKYEKLDLKCFEYTDFKSKDIENEIDPENNFYKDMQSQCEYYTEEQYRRNVIMDGLISIIHFNSRSLNSNLAEIKHCLKELERKFTVIAISETWLDEEHIDTTEIEGYEMFYINRTQSKGGGAALFIDKKYKCKIVSYMSFAMANIMECVTVEIERENERNIRISCIYRKPGSCIDIFREKIEELYSRHNNKKILFVCGDFNIDLLNPQQHNSTTEFINSMYSNSLYPTITRPTRITTHSATLIDNIFTNVIDRSVTSGLIITDISDHLPVFAIIQNCMQKNKDNTTIMMKREKTQNAVNSFKQDLLRQDWKKVYVRDVNRAYETFLTIISGLYDKHCPLVKKIVKQKYIEKPWISKGIINACKKKNLLYKEFLKKRTIEAEQKYKLYKNKLTKIIRCSKIDYYSKLLEDNKNNVKKTWDVLNVIIKKNGKDEYPSYLLASNGTEITDSASVAGEFNKYFVNVGPGLARDIPKMGSSDRVESKKLFVEETMFIRETDEKELIDVVKKLKSKKSTDCHDIDMCTVKNIIESIARPLTYICNQSLQTGVFPDKMKIAKVIPIYKTGDKHIPNNYRPISLLPQFSKILEKMFFIRLDDFIAKHSILCEQQYGFRADRSTSFAIIEFIEKVINAIDRKQYAVGIFLDLKKAFDTVDHKLLIKKLQRYGIRGIAQTWISSYLENRKQYVEIQNNKSQLLQVTCGVPQGSVLGPLLFNLYINNICEVSQIVETILFADDTNLLCCGENLEKLLETMEKEVSRMKIWFDENKLTLNLSKTKFIIFGNRLADTNKKLMINGIELERVSEIKFLGVVIDSKLSWKPHIKYIKTKISKSLAILNKAKELLNQASLSMLYSSFILPYMTYCVEVWGNTYKTNIYPISILQKRAIRIIHKAPYREPTNPLFIKLKILKFKDLIDYKIIQIVFRAHNNQLPRNIQELFQLRENTYNFRGISMFSKPLIRTNSKLHCITTQGVILWNNSNNDLKLCKNLLQLKFLFKKRILDGYEMEQ